MFPKLCSRNTVPGTLFPELVSRNSVPKTLFPELCSQNTVPSWDVGPQRFCSADTDTACNTLMLQGHFFDSKFDPSLLEDKAGAISISVPNFESLFLISCPHLFSTGWIGLKFWVGSQKRQYRRENRASIYHIPKICLINAYNPVLSWQFCTVLSNHMLFQAILCYLEQSSTILRNSVISQAILSYQEQSYAILCNTVLSWAILCAIPSYPVLSPSLYQYKHDIYIYWCHDVLTIQVWPTRPTDRDCYYKRGSRL